MAPKRARSSTSQGLVPPHLHPFLTFSDEEHEFRELVQSFRDRQIVRGRRVDWTAAAAIGIDVDIRRMFQTLPFERVFTIDEPVYAELVYEFLATFTYDHDEITFRLASHHHRITIREFGVALGIWTADELETTVYTSAKSNFYEDTSVHWEQIRATNEPYHSSRAKASQIFPCLRYLHAILAHTVTARKESVGVVTTIEAAVLHCMYVGIPIEFSRLIARLAMRYRSDTRKGTLGLGPFITRIARYYELDFEGADLTMLSAHTVPLDLVILRNMGMYGQPPAEIPAPPPAALPFIPRSPFERYVHASFTRQEEWQQGMTMRMDMIEHRLQRLETTSRETRGIVDELRDRQQIDLSDFDIAFDDPPPGDTPGS